MAYRVMERVFEIIPCSNHTRSDKHDSFFTAEICRRTLKYKKTKGNSQKKKIK